jgi:hypothetical protein
MVSSAQEVWKLLREESSPDGDSLERVLPLKASYSDKKLSEYLTTRISGV